MVVGEMEAEEIKGWRLCLNVLTADEGQQLLLELARTRNLAANGRSVATRVVASDGRRRHRRRYSSSSSTPKETTIVWQWHQLQQWVQPQEVAGVGYI